MCFAKIDHAIQVLEMGVQRQNVGVVLFGRGVDDRVGECEFVFRRDFGGAAGEGGIEGSDDAGGGVSEKESTASSSRSRSSHLASSSWTMVGTMHSVRAGISPWSRSAAGPWVSHSIHAELSTTRIRTGLSGRGNCRGWHPSPCP